MNDNIVLSRLVKQAGAYVKKVTTKRKWDDLILPKNITEQLKDIADCIGSNSALMQGKGIHKKLSPPYKALFHGPAGTGKTFSVSLLGQLTKRKVLKLDVSTLVSKYIGETEKNLATIFETAELKGWILFFDEADALFGKRTQLANKESRFANQEVSYLLQEIKTFNGIVILASTLKNSIDKAFLSRFQSIIAFPIPSAKERLSIWQGAFAGKAKLASDIDLTVLAEKYEITGSTIMNVVRYSSLKTLRAKQTSVDLSAVEHAIKREYAKDRKGS